MYFVYALKSLERNYIYVDLTDNIEKKSQGTSNWKKQNNKTLQQSLNQNALFRSQRSQGCDGANLPTGQAGPFLGTKKTS